jgi:hypothetical protein
VAGISNVVIKIAAETAGAVRDINKVNQALGDQMTGGQKASAALKKAAVPAAAAFAVAGGAILGFTKAAAEDADAQAHLASSMHKTVKATDAQIKASEDYITKLSSATGVADDEMRPALEKLAAATHSAAGGQKQLSQAVDIAAASHTDLATATAAIVKADQGRLGALNKLVPGIDAATIKSKDQTKALEEAAKLTGGAAADAAKTYAGQMKVMSNEVNEAEESIGAAFLPILGKLLPVLKDVTDVVSKHTGAITFLIAAVATVSGVILAANIAMKAWEAATLLAKGATILWTGAQWLLNAALDANPIGLIVLAIVGAAGLIFALKKAYDSSKTFHDAVDDLFGLLKRGIDLYLTPYKVALGLLADGFGIVKRAIEAGIDSGALGAVKDAVLLLLEPLRTVHRIFVRIADISFDALVAGIQTLIGWLGKIHIPKVPDWVPGLGRSVGGYALSSSVPGARSTSSSSIRAAGSSGVTINVFGALDAEGTARQIRRLLDAHDRRQGHTA